ncbi:chemotaxis protein CheW, partial [Desulfobulbus sp. TB]|nr:chemotaxis protein CheW [Desulfobulbus sp. TB]
IVEAAEHLEEMETSLLQLEQDYEGKEILDEIFRSIHTIKGAAQFVGIERVSELSHKLENLLDLIRKDEIALNTAITDLLIAGKDRLTQLVDELERTQTEKTEVADLVEQVRRVVEGDEIPFDTADATDPFSQQEVPPEAEQPALLAEENMSDEYDEELYDIFLQQLKENIPFLYAQTVELSISVDKQDVLYRCSDSIKSLKSSANYMGYEKLTQHYSNWQHAIENAVEQLSNGKMPNLSFMQDYLDEIICSFPQAMEGYSHDDAEEGLDESHEEEKQDVASIASALDSIFSGEEPAAVSDSPVDIQEETHNEASHLEEGASQGIDLDRALDSIFSDENSEAPDAGKPSDFLSLDEDASPEFEEKVKERKTTGAETVHLEYELSGDEYDEELISIFLKKLKDDIEYIQAKITEYMAGGDKRRILEKCHDAIGRLASSANYMEYVSLTAFCEVWQNVIEGYLVDISSGIFSGIDSGLQEFVDKIIKVYPQLVEDMTGSAEFPEGNKVSTQTENTEDAFSQDNNFHKRNNVSATSAPENTENRQDVEQRAKNAEDKILFDKLSTALDNSDYAGDASTGSLDSVIEEIMESPEQKEQAESTIFPEDTTSEGEGEHTPSSDAHLLDQLIASNTAEKEEEDQVDQVAKSEKISNDVHQQDEPVIEEVAEVAESNKLAISEEVEKVKETEKFEQSQQTEETEIVEEPKEPKQPEKSEIQEQTPAKKVPVRSSIRVDAEKIDYLMNQVGELVVSRAYFAQLVNEMRSLEQELLESSGVLKSQLKPLHEFAFRLSEAGVHLGRVSNELQEGVMKVRMLPIDQLFKRYPRLVRDLVHGTNKDIKLVTKGEETELDKMVIESISDPLIHIIRNSVDHGLESIEERLRKGKPAQGTLVLEAFHESDHIVLEITDDGRGIDSKRIKAKALEKGLARKEELERMPDQELTRLIMLPGFSTAEKATKTSGRGVGMDVVKKNIEKLNGTVEIASESGKGTQLRIKIPLTMAIIQALMVRVGKEKFTIPLTTVEETLRVFRDEISEIEGVHVIHLRENTMPIFQLSQIYNIDRQGISEDKMFVVVVSTGTQELGLVVDELLGQEEVVIKPLADYLRVESGFGGATILGDGGISLILDIPELVKIAKENQIMKQGQRSLGFKRKKGHAAETTEQVH